MSGSAFFRITKNVSSILAVFLFLGVSFLSPANAAQKVTTYKDEKGWKLKVDGKDYYVKGVDWGYTPRGENFNYNLYGQSDDFIRKVLDYDFGLMKAAGVNTVRSFSFMPPKWITYVYEEYGIMTVINPLMGRYGYNVGGKWIPFTDYSDELTRATLKKDTLEIVNQYKNIPGVLMFAFGNESNYGLSWKSFEIENLPEGERNTEKARYLYSLFNEVIRASKTLDPNHPFTIVNGDIQYIDLIAEYCKDIDLLGVNAYRGKSFTGLWADVSKKLDLPVLFFEFGSDAYNSRTAEEDQLAQATILKEQWREMYNKSYGNGEEGNSIGGFVFEWRDEWWKYLQEERLDIHDTHASWANGGYPQDFVEGQNNMNEEWWGITALGTPNADGVYTVRTRMAYDVLSAIWQMDPYQYKKEAINQAFNDINMDYFALKSEVRALKAESKEKRQTLSFTGGRLMGQFVLRGNEQDIDERGENGTEFSDGEMVFLDFAFQPTERIEGQFTVNILGNVADTRPITFQYGQRGLPVTVALPPGTTGDDGVNFVTTTTFKDRERVEIYDFEATYKGDALDFTAFYHVPRYHWKYEGDFFGLVREATDLTSEYTGEDIWNAKAPEGVEFAGKGSLEGLKVIAGPEVYWGANPKAVLKYSSTLGRVDYTFMHAEDVARQDQGAQATAATEVQTRQTTLYGKTNLTDKIILELGGIMASTEKADDEYVRVSGDNIILDTIDFKDTLGIKAKLTFDLLGAQAYLAGQYAGLVADGGATLVEFGTQLPYAEYGNKEEYEAGVMMNFGNLMIFPRALYRKNLVDSNPFIPAEIDPGGSILFPGVTPRNRDADPFAVLGNREAKAAELMITWDPTGATPFYQWDNDWREDASFAFNIGANYTDYPTATDSYQFFFDVTGQNAPFGAGLPEEEVWSLSSRMVFNPSVNARYILNLSAGYQQSTGNPTGGTRKFYEAETKVVLRNKHIISGYFKKDAWGPYDFQRQFNFTFPEQYKLDYSILLDNRGNELNSTRVGIRGVFRTLDENSPSGDYLDGANDYQFLTDLYFTFAF